MFGRGVLDTIDGEPFVQIFAFGEDDGLFQVSGAKDCGCIAFQLARFAALLHRLLRLERIPRPRISPTSAKHKRYRMKGCEMGDGIPSEEKGEVEGGYIVPRKDIVSRSSTANTATRAHIRHPVVNKTSRPVI